MARLRPLLAALSFALLVYAPTAHAADSSSAGPGKRAALAAAVPADAITFSEYSPGTSITTQYLSRGVRFTSDVFISTDTAQPTSPALSGTPKFDGPIEGEFTIPGTSTPTTVDGFTIDVGYINNRDSVVVEYFDAAGRRLGSRLAQSYGINHIATFVRGIASFSIHRVAYEAAGFTIDNLSVQYGAAGIRPARMASLGDSYSSGEGLIPDATGIRYDCATDLDRDTFYRDTTLPYGFWFWNPAVDCDTRTFSNVAPADLLTRGGAVHENHCHRHARAYPNAIRAALGIPGQNAIFVACSGAVTANIGLTDDTWVQWKDSPANVAGGQLQFTNVDDWARAGGDPDVVTVGIGGNDAGFTGIIIHCATKDCANDWDWRDGVINGINGTVYRNLQDTFDGLRGRFPNATMYAFGYPSVTQEDLACAGVSLWKLGIQADERAWVADELLPALNAAIADAAAGAGLTYVDITAATAGHEICTDEPYINGLRGGTDRFNAIANESFHPNQNGHDAIAQFFLDHYTDGAGRLLAVNPEPETTIRPEGGAEIKVATVDAAGARACGTGCLQPAACVQACNLHLEGHGFSPGVQLQATLLPDAAPQPGSAAAKGARAAAPADGTPLGAFTAGAEGSFAADVQLPAGIGEGEHAIEFTGEDADAVGQSAIAAFYVFATDPGPRRVDPPRPAPQPVTKPAPRRATLKVLGWKGKKVYVRVGCPKAVTGSCKVKVALQAPGKKTKKRKHPKGRTLRTATVTVKAGRTKIVGLSRGRTTVARKRLTLSVTTTTTAGAATASKSLKAARTLRKVPKK